MRPTANTRGPAGKWNGVHHSESATPDPGRSAPEAIPPDKTKATAGNGGESQDIKVSDLVLSSLPDGADIPQDARRAESALTFEDRQAAITVAFDAGRHYQAGLDVEDRARALLVEWSRESRSMATHYAAKVGPHWLALITECSEVDD